MKPKNNQSKKWRKVYETRIGGSDGELSFRIMGSDYAKEVELVRDGADYLLRIWQKSEAPNNNES